MLVDHSEDGHVSFHVHLRNRGVALQYRDGIFHILGKRKRDYTEVFSAVKVRAEMRGESALAPHERLSGFDDAAPQECQGLFWRHRLPRLTAHQPVKRLADSAVLV